MRNAAVSTAAQAIAMGVLSNTLLKLTVELAIGRERFQRMATTGPAAMAVASAVSIGWLR